MSLVCQISCSRILVLTVTGVTHPNGPKICDEDCSMSLLLTNVLIAGRFLVESEIMSVVMFQRRPRSPTVVLGSLVLSFLVTSFSCLLFVNHDLRLNLAWLIRS